MLERKYVLRKRIGEGGIGSVFLADQLGLGRSVAIKFLHSELIGVSDLVEKMHDEAVVACHVRNPHSVAVFDCGALPDGTPYIVMEYVPGRSLGQVIAEETMPLARALGLFDQILRVLAVTHHRGIVHGDVKSDNFLIEVVDGVEHVTMIDFGLAQVIGASPRADLPPGDRVISGTPEYMAPEVVTGDPPQPASDLYGAGVILYELLTGTTPFGGGSAAEIMERQTRDPVIPPSARRPDRGIPPAIDRVVLRALEKRPEARFADAAAFARELWTAAGQTRRPAVPGERAIPAPVACARGTQPLHRADLDALRHAIADALRRGDVMAIADGYLALADALIQRRRPSDAARELQEGIDILTSGSDLRASHAQASADRLVVALAALYEESGDDQRARGIAAGTDRRPTWTSAR